MRFFFWFYLRLTTAIYFSPFLRWLGVHQKRLTGFRKPTWKKNIRPPEGTLTTWFHAASTGELEILVPLIEEFAQKGIPCAVSIFSESALPFLDRLPSGLLYRGFSPPEADWRGLFEYYRVNRVIVSKYEAWPALWLACSDRATALLMINAQWRRSLKLVRHFIVWFGGTLPRLFFFVLDPQQEAILKEHFPDSRTQRISDPRWMRIMSRVRNAGGHKRVLEWGLAADKMHAPRPYVMMGSAWMEDLEALVPPFKKVQGTLWVVPHSLKQENVRKMQTYLEAELPGRFILVKEMGILVELYSLADRVWVGGGFGPGIHSTMEPSAFSLPIGCGPKNVSNFHETRDLIRDGWLTVCERAQVQDWLQARTPDHRFDQGLKSRDFSQLIEDCVRIR